MNKNLYRLIFNQARGARMAVQETASTCGKARGATRSTGLAGPAVSAPPSPLSLLHGVLLAGMAGFLSTVHAQIVSDPSAPGNQRPTVLVAPNGVPLVNIQTPSAAGVSRNTYSQFDVNAQGAILNNARTNAQTQLGGWVQGNPWLAGGAARVILNEVNSSNPSQLRGFVEVGGNRAEVVIANPAGVNINGGGFINASRATITTGTPVMSGGNLDGYVVQKGLVSINGAGLDSSQTDFTGIIARAVEVNAGIWAKELKVTTGAKQVDAAQSTAIPVSGSGAAPAFALDVSQLGGMYAGKITLVGTEAGVGVRNAGTIGATAGEVVVTVDGMLQNAGRIASSSATRLHASGGISNTASGTIYSTGDTSLSSVGNISNAGQIAAQGNTTLTATGAASQISSVAGSVLAAGLREDGTFPAPSSGTGKLAVSATQSIAALGQNLSSGEQSLSAASIKLAGSQASADSLSLAAGAGGVDASSAAIAVAQGLTISTAGVLRTDAAKVSAGQLGVTAHEMSNVAGEIIQTGAADTRLTVSGNIDNTGGNMASNGNTRISAQNLVNRGGKVQAAGAAHLDITTAADLDNSAGGKLSAGGNATLVVGSLNNSLGQIQAGGSLGAAASQAISNAQGLMAANGAVTLTAASLDNTRGTIASVLSQVSAITSGATLNDSGRIEAAGNVTLVNAGLSNALAAGQGRGGSITGQQVSIDSNGQTFNNTGGTVAAGQGATLSTGALNNQAGLIQAGGTLLIDTHGQTLDNTRAASHATGLGGISAQGPVTLRAADIHNAAGFIGAQGVLDVAGAHISNTAGGQIIGESTVAIAATDFDNRGGQIQALGSVSVDAGAGSVNNTASLIRSADTVSLTAASVTNSNTGGTDEGIEGRNVVITARALGNNSGAIRADNNATVSSSGSINNSVGLISAGNVATLQDTASSRSLTITNSAGTIIADQGVAVSTASLTGDGRVLSKGDLSIALTTDFSNSGEITANHNVSIETSANVSNSGKLKAGNTLAVSASNIDNAATGDMAGALTKITTSGTLTNRGVIDGQDTLINAGTLNNLGTGRIYGDLLSIQAGTVNNRAEGGSAATLAARQRLDVAAVTINNSEHALIFSGGDMAIGGSLDANRRATGQASSVNNASATVETLGNLTINAAQLNNTNNHFSTQQVAVSSAEVIEYQGSGSGTRYLAGAAGVSIYNDESDHLATPEGNYESWSKYQYTRGISETVVTASDPGQILSGGSMTINATNVLNDKSRIIASGALNVTAASVQNTEVAGQRVITDAGSVTSYWRNHKKGRDDTGSSSAAYNPATVVQGISLTPTVYRPNTAPAGTGTTLAGAAVGSVNGSTSAAGAASAAARSGTVIQVNAAVGASAQVVRTLNINTTLPNNSLFRVNPNAAGGFLIETDPRFASYRQWLSSDYMLQQLSLDPSVTQKRLGDGFYEQKLIREQVAELTGRRFLDGYASDEAQYQALMQSGVTLAQQLKLRPGIALSAAQMAQLTSDIVWLVEREVTLPDGTVTKALVPQLYVRVKDGDLTGEGALISATATNLKLSGDLTNSGSIAGRTVVALNAQNVQNLAGRIRGAQVAVAASNDLNNIGGQIIATDSLAASAGRDLNITSTTRTQTGSQGSRTNIDRVAGLYVSNPGGTLVASAGRDANIIAGVISNAGQGGTTVIAAGRDLNLGTVTEASSNAIRWDANNFRSDSQSAEAGSQIQAKGNIQLSAGNNLNARAAQVSSSEGALTASAGNNINITAGQSSQSVDEGHQHTSKGFLSKKAVTTRDTTERTDVVGSAFSGNTMTLLAGKDINLKGSSAVSDQGTTLVAGNNINIEAAQNTYASSSLKDEKKSGIFSGGGLSITAGKQQQSTDIQNTRTTAAASTVGSIGGNVTIQAGESYKQVGSDVLAPGGDISISAKKVDIIEARETSQTVTEQKFKQSGLTLAITSPVVSAIQTVQQMSQAAGQTSDGRMQALAAATTALAAKNAYDSVAADPAAAGGLNLSLSGGSSQDQSTSRASSDLARGSTVAGRGDVRIVASGAAQDSDILVRGSTVQAGNNATLIAEDEINLLAAANTSQQDRNSSGSSTGIGVAFTVGSGGTGFGITANASASKGQGEGQDTSWTNTQVEAGRQLNLLSGGDTTLKGAVARAEAVLADVGGNLNIESLQDTSTYKSKDQSLGGSVTMGIGFSGSVNASQQNINSDFASVMEQSGIKAGDGGFDVNVWGNTDLKGAVIASTDKAVQDGKNTFTTGTLTQSEIQNKAEYSASSMSLGGGYSDGKGLVPVGGQAAGAGAPPANGVGTDADGKAQTGAAQTPGSTLPGYNGFSATVPIALGAKGSASSTTGSGISAGVITINNDQKQHELTGKTAEQTVASIDTGVRSDKDASNALKPIFNEQEIKAKFEIVGALARETGTFLANRAKEVDAKREQANAAERQANDPNNNLTDNQRVALLTQAGQLRADAQSLADKWGPGGPYRQITTALAAAAGGNVSAASGQFVQNMVANYVQQQGAAYVGKLVDEGALIEGSPAHAALQAMVACGGSVASGQSCASGAGGAAAASLLTNLFADSTPNETQAQKEAKRNLLISLVTGISAVSGGDAATAANAATSATDNNWLATQQKVQMTKELEAATSLLDKAKITAKWTYVSGKQDVLIAQGLGKGMADAGWDDIKGMAAFLSDPAKGLAGLKEIINSPTARQQMGDVAFKELDAQIDRMQTALQTGGDQNAEQFGQDVGSLVWRVGSIVTGAGGLAKGSIALTKAGINMGVDGLQAMSGLGKFETFVAKGGMFASDGKPLMDFSSLSNAQKSVIGDVMGGHKVESLVPGAEKIGRAPGIGQTGIDDLYKSTKPGVDYVVVEYKFGSSVLKQTKDGLQMSDDWLRGSHTEYNRILESVGRSEALLIEDALKAGRVEKWLVHTDPFGKVTVGVLDEGGKLIPNPQLASKILGGGK